MLVELYQEEDGYAQPVLDEGHEHVADTSDASGSFGFDDLQAGTYVLCFSGPSPQVAGGCRTDQDAAGRVVVNGTRVTVTRTAGRAGSISGTIAGRQGVPATGSVSISPYAQSISRSVEVPIDNGAYSVGGLDAGTYAVCTGGYLTQDPDDTYVCHRTNPTSDRVASPVEVQEGSDTSVDLALQLGGSVQGTVSGPDGEPVTGAMVYVQSVDGTGQGQRLGDGRFMEAGTFDIHGVSPGEAVVCVWYFEEDGAYDSECWNDVPYDVDAEDLTGTRITVVAGGTEQLEFELRRNRAVTRPGGLVGRVQDEQHEFRSGVVVTVFNADGQLAGSTATDTGGDWLIEDLEPGDYTICFEDPHDALAAECHEDRAFSDDGSTGDPATVWPGRFTFVSTELATVPETVVLDGTVTGEGGVPLEDVAVYLWGDDLGLRPDAIQLTDEDGRYVFEDLDPSQPYSVCFEATGSSHASECFEDVAYSASGSGASRVELPVGLTTWNAELEAAAGSGGNSVVGIVTRSADASQTERLYVSLWPIAPPQGPYSIPSSVVASDGSFAVNGVPDGAYYACAQGSQPTRASGDTGFEGRCLGTDPLYVSIASGGQISLTAGQRLTALELSVGLGSALSVRVVDSADRPLDAYVLVGWDRYRSGAYATTHEVVVRAVDGVLRLTDLPSGRYYVCAGFAVYDGQDRGYQDRCHGGIDWVRSRNWSSEGGTSKAASDGATVMTLLPGDDADVITITLPDKSG